jgi:hypothetical protein
MTDRTEPIGRADQRRWIVEQLTTVQVGGEITDPEDGKPLTAVTVRMPAFAAAHLASGLAALSQVVEMMSRSSFDETEMVAALRSAVRTVEVIDRRSDGSASA